MDGSQEKPSSGVRAVVLGTAQDGGRPQVGCFCPPCTQARQNPALAEGPSCLALIDDRQRQFWLLDATPDVPRQYDWLQERLGVRYHFAGAAVTHAHIGHYLGLAQLGREVMGARGLPVYASPALAAFLMANGPWSQLVRLGNIQLHTAEPDTPQYLSPHLTLAMIPVPHRQEFSDTMAIVARGPRRRLLYLPDIDRWEAWDRRLADVLADVDIALLDGTFFDAAELPGRDREEIPHPTVVDTLALLQEHAAPSRVQVYVTHLNHSNRLWDPAEAATLAAQGLKVARRGNEHPL